MSLITCRQQDRLCPTIIFFLQELMTPTLKYDPKCFWLATLKLSSLLNNLENETFVVAVFLAVLLIISKAWSWTNARLISPILAGQVRPRFSFLA